VIKSLNIYKDYGKKVGKWAEQEKGEKYVKENFKRIGNNQRGTPGYQIDSEVPIFRTRLQNGKRKGERKRGF